MWSEFYEELKKRRVFRAGAQYVFFAGAAIQATISLQPYLNVPSWVVTGVITALAFGFPIVVVLAWAYDVPDGSRWTRRLRIGGAASVVVMLVFSLVGALSLAWRQDDLIDDRIVVSPFTNESGETDLDPIGRLASDRLTEGISQMGKYSVVPTQDIMDWWKTERPAATKEDPARLLAVATSAGTLVRGSYYLERDSIRIVAQVWDVRRHDLLGSTSTVRPSSANPVIAIDDVRRRVMGLLASDVPPESNESPPSYDALRLLMLGSDSEDLATTVSFYQRAAEADTALWGRATIYQLLPLTRMGEFRRVDSLLHLVEMRPDALGKSTAAFTKGWRRVLQGGVPVELTQKASYLDSALTYEQRHNFGFMAPRVNRPGLTIILWKNLESSDNGLSRMSWNTEVWTEAYHMLGQHRRELRKASDGRKKNPDKLTHVSYSARALAALGKVNELNEVLDDAMLLATPPAPLSAREVETYSYAPFRLGPNDYTMGDLYRETGLELRAHGNAEVGDRVIERALEWYTARTDALTGTRRPAFAATYIAAGKWDAAKAIYKQLAREQPDNIDWKGRLGMIAAHQRDATVAMRIDKELNQLSRPYMFGRNTYWRAVIEAHNGHPDAGVQLFIQAKGEGWPLGAYMHVAPELAPLIGTRAFDKMLVPPPEN